jgi:hypothetical protein
MASQVHNWAWAEVDDGTDPFWRWEPDPSQFRLLQLGTDTATRLSAPTAADRDRQFRYAQRPPAADLLTPFDRRCPAQRPIASLSPGLPVLATVAGPASPSAPLTPAAPAPGHRACRDTGVSPRGRTAHGHHRRAPRTAGSVDGTRTGRWVAMASAGLLGVATVAVVLAGHHHGTADRASQAARASEAARASQAARASLADRASLAARARTTDAGPSASAPPPTIDGLMIIAPGVATAPHEAAVVALLNSYFGAIDRHAYRAYKKLFSPAGGQLSAAAFRSGYATVQGATLTLAGIGMIGAGEVEALVTVTSHQGLVTSPAQSSCTAWRIAFRLIKQDHRYLLATQPTGSLAAPRSCA